MKRITFLLALVLGLSAYGQNGYEIKITFKPFKKQYVYLGHYFGKTYPIVDSALLNDKSEAVFKGDKKLQGGIYLIGYPNKNGFFEILVDKEQHFSIIADTATMSKGIDFVNSKDNTLFKAYQQRMSAEGKKIAALQQQLKTAKTKADSVKLTNEISKTDKAVYDYRQGIMKSNPGSILAIMLNCMREPELTGPLKNPKTKNDSLAAYQYFKSHYWDGVNFWDGRLAYTTFFEGKLDKYFEQLVVPDPDSVIKEIDWMVGYSTANAEMNRFLLVKFVNRYLNQKYMWEDKVFVHLFERFFANKTYDWLNEKGRQTITDRAYSLMANIIGSPAPEVELPDTAGAKKALYNIPSAYTLVAFWDPTCGHCKEVLPKVDSFYVNKWKAAGLRIFAVAKETEGSQKDWKDFINKNQLQEWTHVYYSKADEKARTDNGVPGYSQLYDVQSFPTLILLDKDKHIIAKKLAYDQIDEILNIKLKAH
jgi:thiol-disulfide isomerase/thioredoxin